MQLSHSLDAAFLRELSEGTSGADWREPAFFASQAETSALLWRQYVHVLTMKVRTPSSLCLPRLQFQLLQLLPLVSLISCPSCLIAEF